MAATECLDDLPDRREQFIQAARERRQIGGLQAVGPMADDADAEHQACFWWVHSMFPTSATVSTTALRHAVQDSAGLRHCLGRSAIGWLDTSAPEFRHGPRKRFIDVHPLVLHPPNDRETSSKMFGRVWTTALRMDSRMMSPVTRTTGWVGASSRDYTPAQAVYDFLTGQRIEAFFSRESLPAAGVSDYRKQIDAALDRATHMVVVTSSADNARSTWLEAEWGFFVNEKRSGRKDGNLITVVVGTMKPADLPPSLRYYEVIPFAELERVLYYVGGSVEPSGPALGASIESAARPSRDKRGREVDRRFGADAWHLPDELLLGFVEVPAGPFLMGSDKTKDPSAFNDEMPQSTVDLPTFYIGRYPVTVAQFKAFADASGFRPGKSKSLRGMSEHPVVFVSWREALAYCRWLEGTLRASDVAPEALKRLIAGGWHAGLPSEAEWEKAARGIDGRIYPWGDTIDPSRANYTDTRSGRTSPVGAFPMGASPYGILDMSGNVWEWTRSLSKPYPYDPADGRESLTAKGARVVRGGSFDYGPRLVRAAFRLGGDPDDRNLSFGFRVVVSRSRS